jgi:hypothetical protein
MSEPRRRQSDQGRAARWWAAARRVYRDVWLFIITVVAVYAVLATEMQVATIKREGNERRDQTCRLFESAQRDAIERLRRSYEYIEHLPKRALRDPLNIAVLAQLPSLRRTALTSGAPPYCDAPGVGLPEPDPPIPPIPPDLP